MNETNYFFNMKVAKQALQSCLNVESNSYLNNEMEIRVDWTLKFDVIISTLNSDFISILNVNIVHVVFKTSDLY